MGFIQDLFSGGAGTLVDSVGRVLDNVVTTKEEKMTLDNEIRKSEMQFQLDMKKLSNEEQQMILGDISSARQRRGSSANQRTCYKTGKKCFSVFGTGNNFHYTNFIFRPDIQAGKCLHRKVKRLSCISWVF